MSDKEKFYPVERESIMPYKHRFQTPGLDEDGITFDTTEEAAEWLTEHPQHITSFVDSLENLAHQCANWNDMRGMREIYTLIVDALTIVKKNKAKRVLE